MINKDIQIAQVVPATAVIVPENRHTHMSLADKLAELDTARQKGLLSEEEYGISKKSVLRQFEEVSSAAPNEATVPKGDVMEREVYPRMYFMASNNMRESCVRLQAILASTRGLTTTPWGCVATQMTALILMKMCVDS
jgi:hypothetical protein